MARLRIGLTGGIASGKSAVASRFAERGAVIIDADLLAREAVAPGTPGLEAIRRRFGDQVLTTGPDGRPSLDRAALGRIVFADPQARRDLEAIVHPVVRRRAAELEEAAGPDAVVIQVIPLLVETGQQDAYDVCLVVDVDEETQLRRLLARDDVTEDEAWQRIRAQASRQARLAAADVVVDNSGDLSELDRRIKTLAREWRLGDRR